MKCGVDIVSINRIQDICSRQNFLTRCFTEDEICYFDSKSDPSPSIAANFAAKEAFAKAMGTGVRGFNLRDIAVLRDELGAPYFVFGGSVAPSGEVKVSLSHDGGLAIAFVIMEE